MPRSVPNNDVMEKQQAADRKPAGKSTKSKATAKPEQDSKAKKTAKAKATGSAASTSRAKAVKDASSVSRKKAAAGKVASGRADQAQSSNEELREQARPAGRPKETSAKANESDARANRGLGRLFSFFRRSRGRRKLEQAADAGLGKKK